MYTVRDASAYGLGAGKVLVVHNWYGSAENSHLATIGNASGTDTVNLYDAAWDADRPFAGTDGGDQDVGGDGGDAFTGAGGDDIQMGLDGDDTLNGGAGTDLLIGGAGNDTYLFAPNSGTDLIIEESGSDTVHFTGGISSTGVTFLDTVDGLLVQVGDPANGNRIVVRDWFTSSNRPIESWVFDGDNVTLTAAQVDALISGNRAPIVATPIADQVALASQAFSFTVPGASFTDANVGDTLTYTATLPDGVAIPDWLTFNAATRTFSGTRPDFDTGIYEIRVTATDPEGRTATDTFNLYVKQNQQIGGAGDDTLTGTTANDALEGRAGNDTLIGGDGADELDGGEGRDLIDGGSGNDRIYGGAGEDRIEGGAGNDWLEGGAGADTYVYRAAGFGNDTIVDLSGRTRIEFLQESGITVADLIAVRDGADLVIRAGADSITVRDWYALRRNVHRRTAPDRRVSRRSAVHLLADPVLGSRGGALPAAVRSHTAAHDLPALGCSVQHPDSAEPRARSAAGRSAHVGVGHRLYPWLSFDPATRTLSGTPPVNAPDIPNLSVRAINQNGDWYGIWLDFRTYDADPVNGQRATTCWSRATRPCSTAWAATMTSRSACSTRAPTAERATTSCAWARRRSSCTVAMETMSS